MVFPLLEFNSTSLSQNPYKERLIDKFVGSTDHRSVLLKPSSAHHRRNRTPEIKTTINRSTEREKTCPEHYPPSQAASPAHAAAADTEQPETDQPHHHHRANTNPNPETTPSTSSSMFSSHSSKPAVWAPDSDTPSSNATHCCSPASRWSTCLCRPCWLCWSPGCCY